MSQKMIILLKEDTLRINFFLISSIMPFTFLLNTTSNQHFSLSPINILCFFKPVIFLFDSGNWNVESFCKLLITDFYVLNDIFQSNRLFGSHQQLPSWSDCSKLVLQQLKSLFIDWKFHSVLYENQFCLQTAH